MATLTTIFGILSILRSLEYLAERSSLVEFFNCIEVRVGWDGNVEHHGVDLGLEGGVVPEGLGVQVGVDQQQCAGVGGDVPDVGRGVLDVRDSQVGGVVGVYHHLHGGEGGL